MLGVDLDTKNVFKLLKVYFKAKHHFDEDVEVYISSSGTGFHLKIDKEYNNVGQKLMDRAMLGDDPYRISLNLRKLRMNSREKYNDIMFDGKNGGSVEKLNLEGILNKYKEDVEWIEDNFGVKPTGVLDRIDKLSNKVEEEVKEKMNRTWITGFAFDGDDLRERLKEVCEDINEKDESFKFSIYESNQPTSDYVLLLYSDSKDRAMEKGDWFLYKVFNDETKGKVTEADKEKLVKLDEDTYFWVKEKEE